MFSIEAKLIVKLNKDLLYYIAGNTCTNSVLTYTMFLSARKLVYSDSLFFQVYVILSIYPPIEPLGTFSQLSYRILKLDEKKATGNIGKKSYF